MIALSGYEPSGQSDLSTLKNANVAIGSKVKVWDTGFVSLETLVCLRVGFVVPFDGRVLTKNDFNFSFSNDKYDFTGKRVT